MSENAIVVGNGTSRVGFDLASLRGVGHIYGCNALYRNYAPKYEIPDYLVAIDNGMITEIEHSDFPSARVIIPPHDECWEPPECNPGRPRSNAGVNAIREAIKRGASTIIGLGFDFMLMDKEQSVSNIYDETENYGLEVRAHYFENAGRAHYLNWVAKTNPTVTIYLAYPNILDMQSVSCNNIKVISFETLLSNIYRDESSEGE